MKVFLVLLKMRGQTLDLFRKLGHLVLGRARVLVMPFNGRGHLFLLLVRERHNVCQQDTRLGHFWWTDQHPLEINVNKSTITRIFTFYKGPLLS
jgi:hypothetical protein